MRTQDFRRKQKKTLPLAEIIERNRNGESLYTLCKFYDVSRKTLLEKLHTVGYEASKDKERAKCKVRGKALYRQYSFIKEFPSILAFIVKENPSQQRLADKLNQSVYQVKQTMSNLGLNIKYIKKHAHKYNHEFVGEAVQLKAQGLSNEEISTFFFNNVRDIQNFLSTVLPKPNTIKGKAQKNYIPLTHQTHQEKYQAVFVQKGKIVELLKIGYSGYGIAGEIGSTYENLCSALKFFGTSLTKLRQDNGIPFGFTLRSGIQRIQYLQQHPEIVRQTVEELGVSEATLVFDCCEVSIKKIISA